MNPSDFMDVSKLKIRKANGTRRVFGFMEITKTLEKDLMMSTNVYVKRGGQYQLLPFKQRPESLCLYLEQDPYDFMDQIAESSNLTKPVICPAAPVRYNESGNRFLMSSITDFL
jgi:hypothetical protein